VFTTLCCSCVASQKSIYNTWLALNLPKPQSSGMCYSFHISKPEVKFPKRFLFLCLINFTSNKLAVGGMVSIAHSKILCVGLTILQQFLLSQFHRITRSCFSNILMCITSLSFIADKDFFPSVLGFSSYY